MRPTLSGSAWDAPGRIFHDILGYMPAGQLRHGKRAARYAAAFAIARVLLVMTSSCATSSPPATAQKTSKANQKGGVVQIKFARSGGFAGAATNVSGSVEIADTSAHVRSEAAGYERDLGVQEAEQLRKAAASGGLAKMKAALAAASPQRDAYQYDVTVVSPDGSTQSLTYSGDRAPESLQQISPEAAPLISWVRDEAQKIWKQRAAARK